MARRKAQSPYGSCLAARGRLAARQSRHLLGSGPRFSPVCTHLRVGRAFSQLLAGTPSGPGRSSAAARVPRCDEARGRRTSSRFTTPHDRAPQWTRWVDDKRRLKGGDKPGTALPLAPYLPLVGRSGVALLCRATASLLERESATLGWGIARTPPGALSCAPPSPSRGGMKSVAPLRQERLNLVIPAQAGIQGPPAPNERLWIPAFAGMTEVDFRLRQPPHRSYDRTRRRHADRR